MAYSTNLALSRANRRLADFDPDVTTAVIVDLVPGSNDEMLPLSAGYRRFVAGLVRSVGTGGVTAFEIIAATDADGTGAVAVATHAGPTTANAVGDYIWLECDIEQVLAALATATHIGVRVTLATGTDECIIYFERSEPTFEYGGLTADFIS